MAKPIAETPIISGKDAERFLAKMEEVRTKVLEGDELVAFLEERERMIEIHKKFVAMMEPK